ncbi:hypothetical protein IQ231_21295 [Cuspidothrix issatschenkoi LEGE 03284]|nr:hypothetical protein [Cuspidothrix issatschenkoi LEGE 03284]
MILLDSDIIIDFLRKYPPAISWLSSLGEEEIALPGYVAMELMQGCKIDTPRSKDAGILHS